MTEKQIKGIKGWKEDDRPREKCLIHGFASLSDAELIAIIIGSGTRSKTAVDLGREILKSADNSFTELGKMSLRQFVTIPGIGEAKAVTLLAAIEMGRRRSSESVRESPLITSSSQAAKIFIEMLADLKHEEFWLMMLNHANRCVGKVMIASGGVHNAFVDPKIIFNEAVQHLATGIVLCHNHPSGGIRPSELDKKLTRKIVSGANSLDIRVLDHIIVGAGGYFSFADEHLL